MQRGLVAACLTAAFMVTAPPAAAQQVAQPDTLTPVSAPIPPEAPVPRNAFTKALLVPGWGHFSLGETRRGLVYVGLQGTSWAMLTKTIHGLNEVRNVDRSLTALATDSLAVAMAADTALARELESPAAYEAALLTYPGLQDARALARSRQRHRQDWIVYTVVFTFAAAVDAYVTAHLSDFPAEITGGRSTDNGVSVGVRLPAGRSR